jgi:hypothetical protein
VIVAVIAVRVVQRPFHQVVRVIAVRNCLVTAAGSVAVRRIMRRAAAKGSTIRRIPVRHIDAVFLDVFAARMVQMSIVQIIGVTIVLDRGVSTVRTVRVGMTFMSVLPHVGPPRAGDVEFPP